MKITSAIPIGKVLIFVAAMMSLPALAQETREARETNKQFVLVRLSDRKPIANQHLLIFMGATVKEARGHSSRLEVDTNSNGITTLKLDPKRRWFQVWHVDGKSCPGGIPSRDVSDSSVLFDEGVLVSDTCGSGLERLQPYVTMLPPVQVPSRRQLGRSLYRLHRNLGWMVGCAETSALIGRGHTHWG